MSQNPIGLFDSGVGGLSILSTLRTAFPKESFIYIGDTARAPYGDKSVNELWKINQELIHLLLKEDIKALVMACNTSCALFGPILQKDLKIPVIDLIPSAAQTAIKTSKTNKIALLATTRTIEKGSYKKNILQLNPSAQIIEKAAPELVPIIESSLHKKQLDTDQIYLALNEVLKKTPDTIIHGCTHYPILEPLWKKYLSKNNKNIQFINPANTIIPEINRKITKNKNSSPYIKITCTGNQKHFQQFIQTHYPLLNKENL